MVGFYEFDETYIKILVYYIDKNTTCFTNNEYKILYYFYNDTVIYE